MTKSRDTADSINRIDSSAADATAITIDANENVGIGTTSPNADLELGGSGEVIRLSGSTTNTYIRNTDGTTNQWYMGSGGNAGLQHYVYQANPITFHTSGAERMRILAGGGLTFNGDTAAANALDDYEEGTWTPSLPSAWATGITTYDAHYTKIGNLVHITMWVAVSGITGTFTANIGGLPFTAHAGYGNLGTALVYSGASTAITRTYLSQNSTAFNLLNNSANFSTASNTQVGASNIMANFTYRV